MSLPIILFLLARKSLMTSTIRLDITPIYQAISPPKS